jgi:hypothetical protein
MKKLLSPSTKKNSENGIKYGPAQNLMSIVNMLLPSEIPLNITIEHEDVVFDILDERQSTYIVVSFFLVNNNFTCFSLCLLLFLLIEGFASGIKKITKIPPINERIPQ